MSRRKRSGRGRPGRPAVNLALGCCRVCGAIKPLAGDRMVKRHRPSEQATTVTGPTADTALGQAPPARLCPGSGRPARGRPDTGYQTGWGWAS
jgi:hypothetical protein